MSHLKVDYSDLVEALRKGDKKVSKKQLNELRPRLCAYLRATMNAKPEDAEDAVQEALAETYEKLMDDRLKVQKYFFKYLLQACRNEYLMLMRYENRVTRELEEAPRYLVAPSMQVKRLLDEERQKMLEHCIENLKERYKKFVHYYCGQAKWNPQAAADHFGISNVYARKMKSRVTKILSDCVNAKKDE